MTLSRQRYAGLAAAGIAAATDAVYLLVIESEEEPNNMRRVSLVAATIGTAACAAAIGSLISRAGVRLVLLGSAATALIVWGILGILSIGLPLAVAGVLCIYATTDSIDEAGEGGRRAALLASVAVVALTVFGIAATG
jgi:hypothetical protein